MVFSRMSIVATRYGCLTSDGRSSGKHHRAGAGGDYDLADELQNSRAVIPSGAAKRRSRGIAIVPIESSLTLRSRFLDSLPLARNDSPALHSRHRCAAVGGNDDFADETEESGY